MSALADCHEVFDCLGDDIPEQIQNDISGRLASDLNRQRHLVGHSLLRRYNYRTSASPPKTIVKSAKITTYALINIFIKSLPTHF